MTTNNSDRAALAAGTVPSPPPPQEEEHEDHAARVAPLTAGADGQDLPRRDAGVQSSLTAACLDCGLDYEAFPLDVVLPDAQWRKIHPADGGLLCAACIAKRAAALPDTIILFAQIVSRDDHEAYSALKNVPISELIHDEDDQPNLAIGPRTDEQIADLRASALRGDLRTARALLESNGFEVKYAAVARIAGSDPEPTPRDSQSSGHPAVSAAPPPAEFPVLTRDDLESIAQAIEHFVIGDSDDLQEIWGSYVDKLRLAADGCAQPGGELAYTLCEGGQTYSRSVRMDTERDAQIAASIITAILKEKVTP